MRPGSVKPYQGKIIFIGIFDFSVGFSYYCPQILEFSHIRVRATKEIHKQVLLDENLKILLRFRNLVMLARAVQLNNQSFL